MFDFRQVPVSNASSEILADATSVINRANAVHNRLFPGERLETNTISEEYHFSSLVVAYEGEAAIATMALLTEDSVLKVELLAVAPEAQGRQVASKMLAFADEIARVLPRDALLMEAVDVGRLIGYYQQLGFEEMFREVRPAGYWGAFEPFGFVTLRRAVKPI